MRGGNGSKEMRDGNGMRERTGKRNEVTSRPRFGVSVSAFFRFGVFSFRCSPVSVFSRFGGFATRRGLNMRVSRPVKKIPL